MNLAFLHMGQIGSEHLFRGGVPRLIPLRGTQPRSKRHAVAAFSPALADAVGLRWVN